MTVEHPSLAVLSVDRSLGSDRGPLLCLDSMCVGDTSLAYPRGRDADWALTREHILRFAAAVDEPKLLVETTPLGVRLGMAITMPSSLRSVG